MDKKEDYTIDVLKALVMIQRSWDGVKPTTIQNCFKKAGFVPTDPPSTDEDDEDDEEDNIPLAELVSRARAAGTEHTN